MQRYRFNYVDFTAVLLLAESGFWFLDILVFYEYDR